MTDPKSPELIARMHEDQAVRRLTRDLFDRSCEYRYSYNFTWLGRPIIQYPEDVMALQEIVWRTKPDLVVETGIAHGGSLVFFASLLKLLGGDRFALGVDIDIRAHNRAAIESHPVADHIQMIEGSSIDPSVISQVSQRAARRENVLVVLDSNHTEEHVLAELHAYSKLVRKGGYLIVMDTVVEWMPQQAFPDRPWGVGDNPMTAVQKFLARNSRFEIDEEYDGKLLLSVAPRGYLRCIADPE
jgi:cephalosporin hydroxylase